MTKTPVTVVGVDGSAASRDALAWAVRQARLTGGVLRVVSTWAVPPTYGLASGFGPDDVVDFEGDAAAVQKEALEEVLDGDTAVDVEPVVTQGSAGVVLVEMARDADLVVVGSRGHRTLASWVLGSVSTHVLQHAGCPVVVVHHKTPSPAGSR